MANMNRSRKRKLRSSKRTPGRIKRFAKRHPEPTPPKKEDQP